MKGRNGKLMLRCAGNHDPHVLVLEEAGISKIPRLNEIVRTLTPGIMEYTATSSQTIFAPLHPHFLYQCSIWRKISACECNATIMAANLTKCR